MRLYRGLLSFLFFSTSILVGPVARSQQACPALPVSESSQSNIFNPRQEADLGSVIEERFQRSFHVIDDPDVTAFLQRVGEKLMRNLAPNSPRYQFVLYDDSVANAFSISGGTKVYVSRKLVGFVRSEDELAGLLGHELGHLAVHQGAIETSLLFKVVLGVTSVTDRNDIFEKYNKLMDNSSRIKDVAEKSRNNEEADQIVADRIGLYLSAEAGYDPRGLVNFWDRFAQTKGKTGGFFSDLFGATKPEEKRLRRMQSEYPKLPGPCGSPGPAASIDTFKTWQASVLNYSGLGHRESLHSVLFKRALEPPLRGDIRHLRISPDGKYVLAQDDASIYVLTRVPLVFVFRADAPEALPAMFSADSQKFSFYTRGLRVETWNIADQERIAVHDMVLHDECLQSELSPDGKLLACYTLENWAIHIFNVETNEPVFERKDFYTPKTFVEAFQIFFGTLIDDLRLRVLTMRFSTDSHYFVTSSHEDTSLCVDLTTMKAISLPGSVRKYLDKEFVFLAPDLLAGIGRGSNNNSAVVKFPSGEMVSEFVLGVQNLQAAAHGGYLILRPIDKYPVGVMNLETKKVFMADAEPALDIFDTTAVVAHLNGDIGLKDINTKQETITVTLPRGPLAPLRASALSSDLKWVALSERSRGGVWDLTSNQRVFYVRGFTGAYISPDGTLYADFPKEEKTERMMGQLTMATHASSPAYSIKEDHVSQSGQYLIITKPAKEGGKLDANITKEIHDAATGKLLWSRTFLHEAPTTFVEPLHGTITFAWQMSTKSAKQERETNDNLAKQAEGVKNDEKNILMEVVDAKTGKVEGGLVIDTNKGSFTVQRIFAAGNHLIVTDSANRVLVYSMVNGEQVGRTFGRSPAVSEASGLVAIENESGHVIICDLAKMEKRDEYQFTSPIVMKQFSMDGKHLFLLTASQVAYVLDLSAAANPASKTSATNQ